MPTIWNGNTRKVIVSREEVASFNRGWPCSELSAERAYWFEFDTDGDLIDTDVPEHSDGAAAAAMSEDCKAFLFENEEADWMAPVPPKPRDIKNLLARALASMETPGDLTDDDRRALQEDLEAAIEAL